VLVGVAQARVFEFEAKYIGDWMLHCHLPHHMMNQMVSMVGPSPHAGHDMGAMYPKDDPEKKKVPGYPQDMWMVGHYPFRPKAEYYGLRKGWDAAMMGMMTMVRVVTEETYAEIEKLRAL